MNVQKLIIAALTATVLPTSLNAQQTFNEMMYSKEKTMFILNAPTAQKSSVTLRLYKQGQGGKAYKTLKMKKLGDERWEATVKGDLKGKFYTFDIGKGETPGTFAKAVGVNGNRGAIVDLYDTDPSGWDQDVRPALKSPADLVVYELHVRDFSISPTSGLKYKGKYLALTEPKAIEYLKNLGINAIHFQPVFDFASIDETRLDKPQFNWGYDPKNYNVPEGSYATDPYSPATRIKEFKEMVMALHKAGIRVIFDAVYNHTFDINGSNFQRTYPDYYYRKTKDGKYSDGSGCGNETASEKPLMRQFMLESVKYWIDEYHIDGFRFDMTKGFTQNSSTEATAGKYDASRIAILKDYNGAIREVNPQAVVILEHFCDEKEESELAEEGMQLWRNLNNAYCQSAMGYQSDSDFTPLVTFGTTMPYGGWVGFMESHDEERTAFKQIAYSGEPLKSDLNARMKQLATNASFFFTAPGPKMVWQFGEMGYDVSIEEGGRTGKKPLHWEYLDNGARKELCDTYAKLLKLRREHAELFDPGATFSWLVKTANWTGGRFLTLEAANGKKLVVVGNFTAKPIEAITTFPATGVWTEYLNGTKLHVTSMQTGLTIPAHGCRVYTNF